jgi:hypothetical protein
MLWVRAIGFVETMIVKLFALFDKSINVEVRVNEIHNRMAAKNNAILDTANSSLAKDDTASRIAAIDQSTKGMIDSLAVGTGENGAVSQAKKDLEEARKAFDDVSKAAMESGRAAKEDSIKNAPSVESALLAESKTSAIGSFSPFGLNGVGAMGYIDIIFAKIDAVKNEIAGARADERERPRL